MSSIVVMLNGSLRKLSATLVKMFEISEKEIQERVWEFVRIFV